MLKYLSVIYLSLPVCLLLLVLWVPTLPHWFPTIMMITIAAFLWMPRRFSLRALLIAMTLVAVGLGIVVSVSS